ncbi:hypothetical protein F7R91_08105 [Streptomyces luteolifulvus]|uniref:Uncharacterized protein n=1 Tax=Streptomyces luteolifulvus TaxID=2615112 RepID=A0A6H9V8G1_9ACTN|nr:hypothetical protein F7R91_08105 [Streptomyces luteolifulvus]
MCSCLPREPRGPGPCEGPAGRAGDAGGAGLRGLRGLGRAGGAGRAAGPSTSRRACRAVHVTPR